MLGAPSDECCADCTCDGCGEGDKGMTGATGSECGAGGACDGCECNGGRGHDTVGIKGFVLVPYIG